MEDPVPDPCVQWTCGVFSVKQKRQKSPTHPENQVPTDDSTASIVI